MRLTSAILLLSVFAVPALNCSSPNLMSATVTLPWYIVSDDNTVTLVAPVDYLPGTRVTLQIGCYWSLGYNCQSSIPRMVRVNGLLVKVLRLVVCGDGFPKDAWVAHGPGEKGGDEGWWDSGYSIHSTCGSKHLLLRLHPRLDQIGDIPNLQRFSDVEVWMPPADPTAAIILGLSQDFEIVGAAVVDDSSPPLARDKRFFE